VKSYCVFDNIEQNERNTRLNIRLSKRSMCLVSRILLLDPESMF